MIKYLKYHNLNYYFKNGSMTTMMPDTCTLNTRIAQKRIHLKLWMWLKLFKCLLTKSIKCLLNIKNVNLQIKMLTWFACLFKVIYLIILILEQLFHNWKYSLLKQMCFLLILMLKESESESLRIGIIS